MESLPRRLILPSIRLGVLTLLHRLRIRRMSRISWGLVRELARCDYAPHDEMLIELLKYGPLSGKILTPEEVQKQIEAQLDHNMDDEGAMDGFDKPPFERAEEEELRGDGTVTTATTATETTTDPDSSSGAATPPESLDSEKPTTEAAGEEEYFPEEDDDTAAQTNSKTTPDNSAAMHQTPMSQLTSDSPAHKPISNNNNPEPPTGAPSMFQEDPNDPYSIVRNIRLPPNVTYTFRGRPLHPNADRFLVAQDVLSLRYVIDSLPVGKYRDQLEDNVLSVVETHLGVNQSTVLGNWGTSSAADVEVQRRAVFCLYGLMYCSKYRIYERALPVVESVSEGLLSSLNRVSPFNGIHFGESFPPLFKQEMLLARRKDAPPSVLHHPNLIKAWGSAAEAALSGVDRASRIFARPLGARTFSMIASVGGSALCQGDERFDPNLKIVTDAFDRLYPSVARGQIDLESQRIGLLVSSTNLFRALSEKKMLNEQRKQLLHCCVVAAIEGVGQKTLVNERMMMSFNSINNADLSGEDVHLFLEKAFIEAADRIMSKKSTRRPFARQFESNNSSLHDPADPASSTTVHPEAQQQQQQQQEYPEVLNARQVSEREHYMDCVVRLLCVGQLLSAGDAHIGRVVDHVIQETTTLHDDDLCVINRAPLVTFSVGSPRVAELFRERYIKKYGSVEQSPYYLTWKKFLEMPVEDQCLTAHTTAILKPFIFTHLFRDESMLETAVKNCEEGTFVIGRKTLLKLIQKCEDPAHRQLVPCISDRIIEKWKIQQEMLPVRSDEIV